MVETMNSLERIKEIDKALKSAVSMRSDAEYINRRMQEVGTLPASCADLWVSIASFNKKYTKALTHLNALEQEIKDKVLVPKEPSDVIINAMYEQCDGYNSGYYTELYKAMINAAQEK